MAQPKPPYFRFNLTLEEGFRKTLAQKSKIIISSEGYTVYLAQALSTGCIPGACYKKTHPQGIAKKNDFQYQIS